MTKQIGVERTNKNMDRFRVKRENNTVEKLCKITGEFHHYKTFDELTYKEMKKVNKFYVYNLKVA